MVARRAVARVVVYAVVCVEPRVDDRHRQGVVEPELAPTVGLADRPCCHVRLKPAVEEARAACRVVMRRPSAVG